MTRRTFLTTTLATGLAGNSRRTAARAQSATTPRGMHKNDLPTPSLLLDLEAFESNLSKMAGHCAKAGCAFRPHAKTHKCPEIAVRQVKAGAVGISVATVFEAEAMVQAGIQGVLLTSPIVEPSKIRKMVSLAKKPGQIILALGHLRQAQLLDEAGRENKTTVDVLIDLDIGDRRTGILPGKPAQELAQQIANLKNLRLRGVQAYAGHASHAVGFERRVKVSRAAMGQAAETKELLAKSGFEMRHLSGGSTGTYNIDSQIEGVTELQVGSFIFMDVDYRRIGGRDNKSLYLDFQPSLTVLTTVVNVTHADRVTVDAGTKAFSTDVTHRPEPKGWEGLIYQRAGDEFGAITLEKGAKMPRLGDRLEFLVPHCDPTVNLYDRLYAIRGDRVEGVWPILARKENTRP